MEDTQRQRAVGILPGAGQGAGAEGSHMDGLVSSKEGLGWGERSWPGESPGGEGQACVGGGRRLPARTSRGSRGGRGNGRTPTLGAPDPGLGPGRET